MGDTRREIELRLTSMGRFGLLPILERASGAQIGGGRFIIHSLFAVGQQSYVFLANDRSNGEQVVVKQPSFDYRRPIEYGRADINLARADIAREYRVLCNCTSGHLPRPIMLLVEPAVVPAARPNNLLGKNEHFVVEELIRGRDLASVSLKDWPAMSVSLREVASCRLVVEFLDFWNCLHAAGWFYGDVSARNLMIDEGTSNLRVVDAGNVVPATEHVHLKGYSPAFITPRILEAIGEGASIPGHLASVLPMLAKVLHFALTRVEPFDGGLPDEKHLAPYTLECRRTIEGFLKLDSSPSHGDIALKSMVDWASKWSVNM